MFGIFNINSFSLFELIWPLLPFGNLPNLLPNFNSFKLIFSAFSDDVVFDIIAPPILKVNIGIAIIIATPIMFDNIITTNNTGRNHFFSCNFICTLFSSILSSYKI